jgi:short-chain fatty acids transporter
LLNLFIPSGGGQWIVQGPIMCSAAEQLGLPLGQTVMAVAYGDELTNMLQPFWAIPLMGLTRVDPRRFMGYCAFAGSGNSDHLFSGNYCHFGGGDFR